MKNKILLIIYMLAIIYFMPIVSALTVIEDFNVNSYTIVTNDVTSITSKSNDTDQYEGAACYEMAATPTSNDSFFEIWETNNLTNYSQVCIYYKFSTVDNDKYQFAIEDSSYNIINYVDLTNISTSWKEYCILKNGTDWSDISGFMLKLNQDGNNDTTGTILWDYLTAKTLIINSAHINTTKSSTDFNITDTLLGWCNATDDAGNDLYYEYKWYINGVEKYSGYAYEYGSENLNSYCYQEFANQSTSCGGLSAGTYTNYGDNLWKDGDWDTFTAINTGDAVYMTYTKPRNTHQTSKWEGRNENGGTWHANMTIPQSCWDYDSDKLFLRYNASSSKYFECYNGTWNHIGGAGNGFAYIYEEAMWWNISNYFIEGIEQNIANLTFGQFNATDNITLSCRAINNESQVSAWKNSTPIIINSYFNTLEINNSAIYTNDTVDCKFNISNLAENLTTNVTISWFVNDGEVTNFEYTFSNITTNLEYITNSTTGSLLGGYYMADDEIKCYAKAVSYNNTETVYDYENSSALTAQGFLNVTIISPANNSIINNNFTPTINFNITDGLNLNNYVCRLYIDGVQDGSDTFNSSGEQQINFSKHGVGNYSYYIECDSDLDTGISEINYLYINDTQAPAISLSSPENNTVQIGNEHGFQFYVSDNYETKNCSIYINGIKNTTINISHDGNQIISVENFIDGNEYNWSIGCYDANNNFNQTNNFTFIENTAPNTFNLLTPTNESYITIPVDLYWNLTTDNDGHDLNYVVQYLTNVPYKNTMQTSWSYYISTTENHTQFDIDTNGITTIYWRVLASDGYETTTCSDNYFVFYKDNTEPHIEFLDPTPENNTYTSNDIVSIKVNITDDNLDNTTGIKLYYDTYSFLYMDYVSNNNSNWIFKLDISSIPDGDYNYYVRAQDLGGNINVSETRTVTIDTIAPTITFTDNYSNTTQYENYIFLNTTSTDTNYNYHYIYFDNNAYILNQTNTSYNFTNLLNGSSHTFYACAVDKALNTNCTKTYRIGILPNDAPITSTIPNQTLYSGVMSSNLFDLDDYFTDPENQTLVYNYTANSNIQVVINSNNKVSFRPDNNYTGVGWIIFTASDYINYTNSNNISLFVNDAIPQIYNFSLTNYSIIYEDTVNLSANITAINGNLTNVKILILDNYTNQTSTFILYNDTNESSYNLNYLINSTDYNYGKISIQLKVNDTNNLTNQKSTSIDIAKKDIEITLMIDNSTETKYITRNITTANITASINCNYCNKMLCLFKTVNSIQSLILCEESPLQYTYNTSELNFGENATFMAVWNN